MARTRRLWSPEHYDHVVIRGNNRQNIFGKAEDVFYWFQILDDIYLEISFTQDYVEQLKSELSRFEEIKKYEEKMNSTKKEDSKLYYLEGINSLFKQGENLENYKTICSEYSDAYIMRKGMIDKLYDEIKMKNSNKV